MQHVILLNSRQIRKMSREELQNSCVQLLSLLTERYNSDSPNWMDVIDVDKYDTMLMHMGALRSHIFMLDSRQPKKALNHTKNLLYIVTTKLNQYEAISITANDTIS